MIDKNKYQCWQHPNELLLIANNKCQFLWTKNINSKKKINEWVLKTDMNTSNNKLITAQNKYQC